MKQTLWTRNFTRITAATTLGAAGGIISQFALSFLVFDETGSTLASALVVAIQLIPMAFSATITSFFINRGLGVQYWIAMIVLIIIGILSLIPLLKVKDANAADRA